MPWSWLASKKEKQTVSTASYRRLSDLLVVVTVVTLVLVLLVEVSEMSRIGTLIEIARLCCEDSPVVLADFVVVELLVVNHIVTAVARPAPPSSMPITRPSRQIFHLDQEVEGALTHAIEKFE